MGKMFSLPEVVSVVERLIDELCTYSELASRDQILERLLADAEGQALVKFALTQTRKGWNEQQIAGNMVDWFSAIYATGHELTESARKKFDRIKHQRKWAYFPRGQAPIEPLPYEPAPDKRQSKSEAVIAGYQFEREVAAIYRALGARVEVDVGLAGSQIDILVREQTGAGGEVKTAIECKSYQRKLGIEPVISFSSIASLLRQKGLIDKAVIVARRGFTRSAREAASNYNIDLLVFEDLKQRASGSTAEVDAAQLELADQVTEPDRSRRVFVVMPFAKEFDDVYFLGIREVAEAIGLTVERADDIEHSGNILEVVLARIRAADAVIGDTTRKNPNVFYEIGYSHALEVPTILIARSGSKLPFDLSQTNHIMYENIVDLRNRLEKRLRAMFDVEE